MRTLVDIPDRELHALDSLSKSRSVSRAELVRQAIKAFIDVNRAESKRDGFGLWANKKRDGLKYQQEIRNEWDRI